ncbi:unnamed protein product [marine sediment metagenome]|uniref:Uncharacterized protein n=1 Tax=marine sediment metagenome TaxID=412755 RepID=X1QWL4_9ZZZZ
MDEKTITQPIFFPGRINPLEPDLWYFSKFGIWVSEHFWEDATPVQAFVLGLALIGLLVMLIYLGTVWIVK